MTVWDAADGVMLHFGGACVLRSGAAKSTDGKLWFLTGEDIQVVDPRHLAFNKLPPPIHIERIVADHKMYWQNLPGAAARTFACRREPAICKSTTPLSASPRRRRFISNYKLEGQDREWREVINDRHASVFQPRSGYLQVSRNRQQQ